MKLNENQIKLIDAQIKRLIASESFFGKMLKEHGIYGIESQEDFEKIPFIDKAELRGRKDPFILRYHGKTRHHSLYQEGCR